MNSLYHTYNNNVLGAYIIHVPSIESSLRMAHRCLESCERVGQKAELFEGFDGTSGEIKVPKHLEQQSWVKWLKVTNHFMTQTEISCTLSHIALWVKAIEENRPIVILEHDAIMVAPYNNHFAINSVLYLGNKKQLQENSYKIVPDLGWYNDNWSFLPCAHAYAVDPFSAKKLFQTVLDRGIYETSDILIRCDDVCIMQVGIFAYDEHENISLLNRNTHYLKVPESRRKS
jgi:hypothetical protein